VVLGALAVADDPAQVARSCGETFSPASIERRSRSAA
jgi:hypothetical protein